MSAGSEVDSQPSVSVITICKNAGTTIERTLSSVADCNYPRLQYVVVDGGSTDDTLAHIGRFASHIDKFVSEPDNGISDVQLSDGKYHLVVHADDVLIPESIDKMAGAARQDAQVICGSVIVLSNRGFVRRFVPQPDKLRSKMSVPHMGALISKDAWEAVGGYDTRRRIAMDHLLMLRILNRFGLDAFSVVDETVAKYSLGGVSDRHVDRGFREVRDNLIEEGSRKFPANAAYVQLMVKSRVARLIGKR
jgi:glycosyltransferase involved in cell wall biosynthesis